MKSLPTSPPWSAALRLRLAPNAQACTRLVHNQHSGPLRVQRLLYPEGPNPAHALLLHPPGGIAGGDLLDLNIELSAGARALVTTPGASKWYHGERGAARQLVHLKLADDACLEWLPQEAIVFDAADASQELRIDLSTQARMIGWDIVQFGRIAAGETWQNGRWRQQLQLWREGRLRWRECADLHARDRLLDAPLALAGYPVCGTLWATAPALGSNVEVLLDQLRSAAQDHPLCGISWLPAPTELLLVRVLGKSSEVVRALLEALWSQMRPLITGHLALRPRIWDT